VLSGEDLSVIIPLWLRTKHVERVSESARAATPLANVVFVVSADDERALAATERRDRVIVPWSGGGLGDYARKINAGYEATTEPYLFTGADDLHFHPGWYDAARRWISPAKSLGSIGVVGTVDDCNGRTMNGDHSTHSLVARWYADCCAVIDRPGAIYAECYAHEYCDDELVGYAKSQGAYAHAFDAHVEHLHWLVAKSPDDEVYRRGRGFSRASRRTFIERRRRWTLDAL
jgi:hypothetical protein